MYCLDLCFELLWDIRSGCEEIDFYEVLDIEDTGKLADPFFECRREVDHYECSLWSDGLEYNGC